MLWLTWERSQGQVGHLVVPCADHDSIKDVRLLDAFGIGDNLPLA